MKVVYLKCGQLEILSCVLTVLVAIIYSVQIPLRMEARRVVVRGLFPGAEVVRGWDWRFDKQDGK